MAGNNSKLLSLPTELRNRIWELVFLGTIVDLDLDTPSELDTPSFTSNLLATCRQVRAEAYEIFYATATFYTASAKTAHAFLNSLSPKVQTSLADIRYDAVAEEHAQREVATWARPGGMQMFVGCAPISYGIARDRAEEFMEKINTMKVDGLRRSDMWGVQKVEWNHLEWDRLRAKVKKQRVAHDENVLLELRQKARDEMNQEVLKARSTRRPFEDED